MLLARVNNIVNANNLLLRPANWNPDSPSPKNCSLVSLYKM